MTPKAYCFGCKSTQPMKNATPTAFGAVKTMKGSCANCGTPTSTIMGNTAASMPGPMPVAAKTLPGVMPTPAKFKGAPWPPKKVS